MLKFLAILLSLYFAVILVKHSHAGGESPDVLDMKNKLLRLENYYATVH